MRRGVVLLLLLAGCAAKRAEVIAQFPGRSPSLAFDDRGAVHVAYVDPQSHVVYRGGGASVVVSDDVVDSRGESGPIIVLPRKGEIVIVYPSAKELRARRSNDGGKHWSAAQRINDDATPRSHGFADAAASRGEVAVSWLDSRNGQQGVAASVVGAPNVTVDAHTCQCCRTALLARADGSLLLAYRDLAEGNVRNMAWAVSTDGGRTFVPRGLIADDQWSVNGCPDSGPRLAEANGQVWAAWMNGKAQAIEVAGAKRNAPFGAAVIVARGAVNHPEIGTLPDGRIAVFYEDGDNVSARVGPQWSEPRVVIAGGKLPRYARRGSHAALAAVRGDDVVIEDFAP